MIIRALVKHELLY